MNIPLSAVPGWLQWLVIVCVVLAVIATGIRAVPPLWRFVRRAFELVDALSELQPFLERTEPLLDQMREQIVNSHGHVILRDQIDRIEHASNDTVKRLDRVEEGVAGLYNDQQQLSERFDNAEDTWRQGRNPDKPRDE